MVFRSNIAYRRTENIFIEVIVISELKFSNVIDGRRNRTGGDCLQYRRYYNDYLLDIRHHICVYGVILLIVRDIGR